ncbi:hypothetical protein LCGC14_0426810 [marine sediment metagenome]|uniref:Uncharacterized protein n=1 Tax=marine sediment metagenome TaxID=412755 RepID=A0A0F9SPD2_9ZZZZ
MSLVTDNWATNLNPTPKPFKMWKTLSATAVSGSAVTDTENFFNRNCPFAVNVLGFEVHSVSVSGAGFNGSGSALTVTLQRDAVVDSSPGAPGAADWNTLVSANASGVAASTDKLLFSAPANSGAVINASLDKTYISVPQGGSLRTILSAQARDSIGVAGSTPVELLAIVTCVPTELKDRRYF